MDYLEWIDFDQFDLIENINKRGAFSSIYSAVWMEGPRWKLDEEAEVWNRYGPTKVVLKRLDNSQNMSKEFINQVSINNINKHFDGRAYYLLVLLIRFLDNFYS